MPGGRGSDVPAVFRKLGLHFHRDIDRMVETREDLARLLVGGFSNEERPVLRAYLAEIVRFAAADELIRLWDATPSGFYAKDGEELRRLLVLVRDLLGQGRTAPGWRPVGEGRNHDRRILRPARPKAR